MGHTPVSKPSQHSKPWWSPRLTSVRREFHKPVRSVKNNGTPALREVANTTKAGYFWAIKAAKNKYWSSFLLSATPQTLWTIKKFAFGRIAPCFPSLPGAETP